MDRMRAWTWLLVGMAVVAMMSTACGGTSTPSDGDQETVVADHTRVADADTREALETFDLPSGEMRFSSETALLAGLRAGDILVSEPVPGAAPHGFLRAVVEKRSDADGILLRTEQATLEEAVEQGSLRLQRRLEPSDVASVQVLATSGSVRLVEPPEKQQVDYPWNVEFDQVLIGDPEDPDNQLRVDGHFRFDPALDLRLQYSVTSGLDLFLFSVGFDEDAQVLLTGRFTQGVEEEIELVTLDLHDETVYIGPIPVVISIDMVIVLGVRGEVRAEVVAGARQTASLELGAEYTAAGWRSISNSSFDFDVIPPALEAGIKAEAYAGGELEVTLYGITGPTLYADAVVGADVASDRDPFWLLYGGMDAGVGYVVDLPVVGSLADHEEELLTRRQEIGRSENAPPEIVVSIPDSLPVGQEVQLSAQVADREDGSACCSITWRSDIDGSLGTGRTPRMTFTTLGDHQLTVTATDSHGAETVASASIAIVNPPPLPFIKAPETVQENQPSYFSGGALDDNGPNGKVECSRIEWLDGAGYQITAGTESGCDAEILFSAQGSVTVSMRATDVHGDSATAEVAVDVGPPPTNVITIEQFVVERRDGSGIAEGDVVKCGVDFPLGLSGAASDQLGHTLRYAWDYRLGDSGTWQPIAESALTSWDASLTYHGLVSVRLHVSDGQGDANERLRTFQHDPTPCIQ